MTPHKDEDLKFDPDAVASFAKRAFAAGLTPDDAFISIVDYARQSKDGTFGVIDNPEA